MPYPSFSGYTGLRGSVWDVRRPAHARPLGRQGTFVHRYHNGLKTAVLLATLSVVVLLAGVRLGGARGLVIAFVIALATNGFAYFNSAKLALRSMRAYPVDSHQQPVMYKVVQELATAAGQPMPKLYVS